MFSDSAHETYHHILTDSITGCNEDAIPCGWVEKLQHSEYLLNLCDQFASTKIKA